MIFPPNRVENHRIWCIYAGSDCFGRRNLPNQAENSLESLENLSEFDIFGWVGFHRFWTRGLETDPPALSFRAQDLQPTTGTIESGERQSGAGKLGEWSGGLDNPSADWCANLGLKLDFDFELFTGPPVDLISILKANCCGMYCNKQCVEPVFAI